MTFFFFIFPPAWPGQSVGENEASTSSTKKNKKKERRTSSSKASSSTVNVSSTSNWMTLTKRVQLTRFINYFVRFANLSQWDHHLMLVFFRFDLPRRWRLFRVSSDVFSLSFFFCCSRISFLFACVCVCFFVGFCLNTDDLATDATPASAFSRPTDSASLLRPTFATKIKRKK